jgi:hypothetical protein
MTVTNDNHVLILMPYDESIPNIDYREVHQIIRELTIGIFVLNQYPSLILDANFDESTTCVLPSAYQDTKLGQIMINTDYWLKALWHGLSFYIYIIIETLKLYQLRSLRGEVSVMKARGLN